MKLLPDTHILPIRMPHLLALLHLLFHHRDPFDRLIIAQSQGEQLTVASDGGHFAAYSIAMLTHDTEQFQP